MSYERGGTPAVMIRRVTVLTMVVATPTLAWAHPGRAPEPHDLWRAWTFAPAVVLGLLLAGALYARGLRALWTRGGKGRVVPVWRMWCFAGGVLVLVLALVSPLHAVGSALFAVHMLQHLLLMLVAAPLLVLGDPVTVTLWAFPARERRRIGRWWLRSHLVQRLWWALRRAPVAWTLHVVALWVWHSPSLYESALRHEGVHALEHATFVLTSILFWWMLMAPHGRRLGVGTSVLYLFTATLQSTLLGALITFAPRPWYPAHFGTTRPWGLPPLEDQQLAGLLMWIPAGVVYLAALVPRLVKVLRAGGVTTDTPIALPPVAARDASAMAQCARSAAAAGVSERGTP